MDKRYQIFISSTYVDLVKERDQVIKAILEMGHIPVGMEMFSAADEEQWETIKREIDRSDYYLVIAAHRYGSTIKSEGGIGYTEKEFDYAIGSGVPRLGFVIADGVSWDVDFVDSGANKRKLIAFKKKIKARPVDFWLDANDLARKVSISLPKLMANKTRSGWERSTSRDGTLIAEQLARLIEENKMLKDQIGEVVQTYGGSEVEQILRVLTNSEVSPRQFAMTFENQIYIFKTDLLSLFILACDYLETLSADSDDKVAKHNFGSRIWDEVNNRHFQTAKPDAALRFHEYTSYLVEPIYTFYKMKLIGFRTPHVQRAKAYIDKTAFITELGHKVFLEARMRKTEVGIDKLDRLF